MIHPKVIQAYKDNDTEYHESPYNKHYKNWVSKTRDADTGEPIQPIREEVHVLYRIQDIDRSQHIAWSGFLIGSDAIGNELTFPVHKQLTWTEPKFQKEMYRDMKTDKLKTRTVDITGMITHYERDWSIQTAEELLAKGAQNKPIQLVVYRDYTSGVGSTTNPLAIEDWNEFVNGEFDDICRIKNPRVLAEPVDEYRTKKRLQEQQQQRSKLLEVQRQQQQKHNNSNSRRTRSK